MCIRDRPSPPPTSAGLAEPAPAPPAEPAGVGAESAPREVPVGSPSGPSAPASVGAPRHSLRWAVAGTVTVAVAAAASWAVVESSRTRLAGPAANGAQASSQAIAGHLREARALAAKPDIVDAVKEYQKVLSENPTQVDALTEEGWILVQTGQPSLVQQGLRMLGQAEQTDPGYAPARLYRGLALLVESDYQDAVPELQWYLDHNPDPQLVSSVRSALSNAEAKVKASAGASPAGTQPVTTQPGATQPVTTRPVTTRPAPGTSAGGPTPGA